MAITDGTILRHDPVGAGNVGQTKTFFASLAAGVPKVINFGKHKLKDLEHCGLVWLTGTTAGAVALAGTPDTTETIATTGKSLTATDAAGGSFAVQVTGVWEYNS